MYKIKTSMLRNEMKIKPILHRLEQRSLGNEYSGHCPYSYCKGDLFKEYEGCAKGLHCKECWDKFLDDIVITKKNNMEFLDK